MHDETSQSHRPKSHDPRHASFVVIDTDPRSVSTISVVPLAPRLTPEMIGYTVSNQVTVKVVNPEKVSAVIEQALAAGANHFRGLQWALKEEHQATLGVMKQAVANAREKAATLSESLMLNLLRLLSVNEGGHVVCPVSHASRSMMTLDAGGSEAPIFGGEMKVEVTVTLVYEITRNDAVPKP